MACICGQGEEAAVATAAAVWAAAPQRAAQAIDRLLALRLVRQMQRSLRWLLLELIFYLGCMHSASHVPVLRGEVLSCISESSTTAVRSRALPHLMTLPPYICFLSAQENDWLHRQERYALRARIYAQDSALCMHSWSWARS